MPEKGWKIVPVREELWKRVEKRATATGRSVANEVEAILTGRDAPVKALEAPA